jgi:hypothetical protein
LLCFVLLVVLFSPILDEFTETKLTTDFAFGELPVGQKTLAGPNGDYCRYNEKESWIKHFVGPLGCIKVGYIVEKECGRYTDQWRNDRGMDKCERPVIPESQPKQYEQPKYTEPPKQYEQPKYTEPPKQYEQPKYTEPPKQYEQSQSSNSKINQDDDYVLWAVFGIVGIVVIVVIIKLITKPNNPGNVPPPINPPGGGNDGGKSEIEIETEKIDEETRRINGELYGKDSSSVGNTATDIEQDYQYEEDEDHGVTEIENDYENDDQGNDDQGNDENGSMREDIEERISNNEEALEELREYRQEIEDDKDGGEFAEIHDMYEADRTDDKISDREERIEELNEQLDEDTGSDDTGSDDYDDDDR